MNNLPLSITELAATNVANFEQTATRLMQWQLQYNPVYAQYDNLVSSAPRSLPYRFLPIEMFKNHAIKSGVFDEKLVFSSSSTSGTGQSFHHVADPGIYEWSIWNGFKAVYGDPAQYIFFALLPSYLERQGSSLIWMTNQLIQASAHPLSGFYLYNFDELHRNLGLAKNESNRKIFLLGVSFALLDFTAEFPIHLPDAVIMETGGMKGKRKELTRAELHQTLQNGFGVPSIHSEYGMTELLSQAYAVKDGLFKPASTMQVFITDIHDVYQPVANGKAGLINVVDLCNVSSCAFIQTTDIGIKHQNGLFEVLGRLDHSDLRGCSLMYA